MSHIKEFEHLRVTLEDIKRATNNFAPENCIGRGVYGNVYKGEIAHSNGKSMAAFKRLGGEFAFGLGNSEFWNHIKMLSHYNHENLVQLLGVCDESDEKILVYEYVSNGSLDMHLSSSNLTWIQRLKICIGMARGLSYLHNPVDRTHSGVLHRDVKSSNILLDENWNAKISDFGLPKFADDYMFSFQSIGYVDPLYIDTGILTKESDVYSLGVLLFEVLCGRLCIGIRNEDDRFLIPWVRQCYRLNQIDKVVFGKIRDEINRNSLRAFTAIAYLCLEIDLRKRPSMSVIVRMLETALKYQIMEAISFPKEFEHLKIQLEDIQLATNYFGEENCIGKGGFGKVYKGQLFHSKGPITVALKRLDPTFQQGDGEFWKEMIMLSRYRHKNIVPLLGFCDDRGEKIIVSEYASRCGLNLHLDNKDLTWVRRLEICLEAARGLTYLHNGVGTNHAILHRDIKSANILLDETWNAKIADVGLTNVVGTFGYCDPVYFETGLLTKESDVYSFGVVLFEVLCGKLCVGREEKRQPFTVLVRKSYKGNNLSEIIYDNIKDEINPRSLEVFTRIGYQCLKRSREERPGMKEIVRILETALEYQLVSPPPTASSSSRSKSSNVSPLPDKRSLKPLHWEKTGATVGSIWDLPHKQDNQSRVPEIDIEELESLFSEGKYI